MDVPRPLILFAASVLFAVACSPVPPPAAQLAASPARRITVDRGALEGIVGEHGTTAFLGIPYAAPPTGEWRWKPPRPALQWEGVRSARGFGPACPQVDRSEKIRKVVVTALGGDPSAVPAQGPKNLGPTSEDCLSLNVWTPNLDRAAKLPVMVWIHGGSLTTGSGGDEDAAALAPRGVVVVTINYRLGMLGFLAHPALTKESPHRASGNYGLLDQVEALRWVQRNIAAFGGDPNRVTIFGHSAGGDSVLQLVASPLARGLFQRAIAQSSMGGESQPLAEAEAHGVEVASRFGAGADPLPALRNEGVARILELAPRGFEPVTDGWLLPKPVPTALAEQGADGVPLLIGATAREWAIFAIHSPPAKDLASYRELLRKAGEPDRLFALYPAARDDEAPAAAIRYLSDWEFVCPARHVAANRRARTWLYVVSATPAASEAAARYGATHGSEVRLLFNEEMGIPIGAVGRRIGDAMQRYWTQFAAAGEPNGKGLPTWASYSRAKPGYLEMGDAIRAHADLGRPACDVFDAARSAK